MKSSNPFDSRIFISRVRIENFASIYSCDVELGPLTILTGPNAAGKSNFLKAIEFALSPDLLKDRVQQFGGLDVLLHRSSDQVADSFLIELTFLRFHFDVPDGTQARYAIRIGRDHSGRPVILDENLVASGDWEPTSFQIPYQPTSGNQKSAPMPVGTGPVLHAVLDSSEASDLVDMVACAHFYDLDTEVLRQPDLSLPEHRSDALGESGEHLGHVLGRLADEYPEVKEEIDSYLSVMIPNAVGIDQKRQGDYSEIEARFKTENRPGGDPAVEVFGRASLSEGTLRLAGILAALNQRCVQQGHIKFVAIEEPEKALHPPKLGIMFEVLDSASHMTQVLVTTQSPDLLDNKAAKPRHILVIENIDGATVIGPMNEVGRSLYDDKIFNLTDLMRYGSLHPQLPSTPDESGFGEPR